MGSAQAADMTPAPVYKAPVYKALPPPCVWCGWYVGVNGGYGWSEHNDKFATPSFGGLDPKGGFGGAQIGYNWQSAQFVFGVEADIQGSGIQASAVDIIGDSFKSRLDYFGTVRGRLGYAFGPSLLYATGGLAYGGIENDAIAVVGPTPFTIKRTATGYTIGGGYEYKLTPAWSLKAEYQFINLGRNDPQNPTFGSVCNLAPKCEDDAFHTVRAGVNYHF
jgi:outer membrane immunogenic protein